MNSEFACYYNWANTNFYFHHGKDLFRSTLGLVDHQQMEDYRLFLNYYLYKTNAVYVWRRGSIIYMPKKNTLVFTFKNETMTFTMPTEHEHSFMYGLLTNFLHCAEQAQDAFVA